MGIFRRKPQTQEHTNEGGLRPAEAHTDLHNEVITSSNTPSGGFSFTSDILKEIQYAVRASEATSRVLFSDNMQFLDVVGESFRPPLIANLLERFGREHWLTGYLQPEPTNSYDSNAVMVMLISKKEEGVFEANHVGYLGKAQAKNISRKIIDLLDEDKIIPLIGVIDGGTPSRDSLGVSARAMTRKITF